MSARILVVALFAFALTACGVKTDLDPPQGAEQTKKSESSDPSKPPQPLGR
jgi:predicted small lipoprotein YifL